MVMKVAPRRQSKPSMSRKSKTAMQFSLTTEELNSLANTSPMTIEKHYGQAMDIEWAKDGDSGEIFIVQARPETVKSRQDRNVMERYIINS